MLRMIGQFVIILIGFFAVLELIGLLVTIGLALFELFPALPWILMLVLAAVPMLTAINAGIK